MLNQMTLRFSTAFLVIVAASGCTTSISEMEQGLESVPEVGFDLHYVKGVAELRGVVRNGSGEPLCISDPSMIPIFLDNDVETGRFNFAPFERVDELGAGNRGGWVLPVGSELHFLDRYRAAAMSKSPVNLLGGAEKDQKALDAWVRDQMARGDYIALASMKIYSCPQSSVALAAGQFSPIEFFTDFRDLRGLRDLNIVVGKFHVNHPR